MAVTEITKTSYGQRLGSSFKGIGTGFLMFIIGTCLLFWNEGNVLKKSRSLKRADKVTVEMNDISTVDPKLDKQLVHASGKTATNDILIDNLFGVRENAVKLNRKVEYYQVRETSTSKTKDKVGGGQETVTTYDYKEGWSSTRINSSEFKDEKYRGVNFVLCDAETEGWTAENVTFGAYRLPKELIVSISGDKPVELNLSEDLLKTLNNTAGAAKRDTSKSLVEAETGNLKYIHVNDNVLYIGQSSMNPQIGDVRITFTKVLPDEVSILAEVSGDTFTKHIDPKNGKSLETLSMGNRSQEEMYASEHAANNAMKWIFRLLGFLLVLGGLKGIFEIVVTILKVIPFIANIVNLAMNIVLWVVAFAWSFIVVAIAWIFYGHIVGILFLAIALVILGFFASKGKNKGPQEPQTPEVPAA